MSAVVRDATPADVAALVDLLVGGALAATEDPSDLRPYADALADILADGSATVLVVEEDAAVVGMCQLTILRHLQQRGGRAAEIESVHVDASARSRGLGGLLVEEAVARAVAAGCYRVQLTSNVVRTDAHRFYLRHGFVASHTGFKRQL